MIIVEAAHIEETISTLRFASRMMQVSNDPQINVQYDLQVRLTKDLSRIAVYNTIRRFELYN